MCRKRVPDGRCSNWKTPSAELSSGARNQHVAAFSRTEACPTRDVRSRRADVLEVCWATVPRIQSKAVAAITFLYKLSFDDHEVELAVCSTILISTRRHAHTFITLDYKVPLQHLCDSVTLINTLYHSNYSSFAPVSYNG